MDEFTPKEFPLLHAIRLLGKAFEGVDIYANDSDEEFEAKARPAPAQVAEAYGLHDEAAENYIRHAVEMLRKYRKEE